MYVLLLCLFIIFIMLLLSRTLAQNVCGGRRCFCCGNLFAFGAIDEQRKIRRRSAVINRKHLQAKISAYRMLAENRLCPVVWKDRDEERRQFFCFGSISSFYSLLGRIAITNIDIVSYSLKTVWLPWQFYWMWTCKMITVYFRWHPDFPRRKLYSNIARC